MDSINGPPPTPAAVNPPSSSPSPSSSIIPNLEIKTHTFDINNNSDKITVDLASVPKLTYYGEDVLLTGHSIWFGALNSIQLLTDRSSPQSTTTSSPPMPLPMFNVLEIGAGTGLTGCFLAKLLSLNNPNQPYSLYLTDGEDTCVETLESNVALNGLSPTSSASTSSESSVNCSQLWWGSDEPALQTLLAKTHNEGFDLIIGADLIYSSKQSPVVKKMFDTVYAALKTTPRPPRDAVVVVDESSRFDCDEEEEFIPKRSGGWPLAFNSSTSSSLTTTSSSGGVYYLAFTRRNMPIETVLKLAEDAGLEWQVDPDYCWDIFDNNTDGITEIWRDAIFGFRKFAKEEEEEAKVVDI
jgi:hypothetical protein